jgi:ABC-type uncharacterized transport system fused permease/ATPase subunit
LNTKPKRAKNFDRRLWRRFWNIAKPYWFPQLKTTSCTIVSVAHRSTLIKHHKHILEVVGDGAWHLGQAKDYTSIE